MPDDRGSSTGGHDTELALRRDLQEAGAAYQRATAEYKRLTAISSAVSDVNDPAWPDGTFALRKAMQIHQHARLRYESALKAFTDFVLRGKHPPASRSAPK
jgi:hypothetical protein